MANRFLESNYFKSPFVKSLKGELKSLYSFIICDCTPSGIWCLDLDAAKHYTGFDISFEDFEAAFIKSGKAILITKGKYFFPDFIEHQYHGGLSDTNKAHKNILVELRKFALIDEFNLPKKNIKKEAPLEDALCNPFKGVQGNGIGNGNGLGQGLGQEETPEQNFTPKGIAPEMVKVFTDMHPNYPIEQTKDFASCLEIAYKIAKSNKWEKREVFNGKKLETIKFWEQIVRSAAADKWFSTRSISDLNNEWQRLIQFINNGTGVANNAKGSARVTGQQLHEAHNKHFGG